MNLELSFEKMEFRSAEKEKKVLGKRCKNKSMFFKFFNKSMLFQVQNIRAVVLIFGKVNTIPAVVAG